MKVLQRLLFFSFFFSVLQKNLSTDVQQTSLEEFETNFFLLHHFQTSFHCQLRPFQGQISVVQKDFKKIKRPSADVGAGEIKRGATGLPAGGWTGIDLEEG